MDVTINTARLQFEQALAAFAQRTALVGTARYDDIRSEAHYQAFAVAGAMKADLLADLRKAVARAVEDGVSLDEFRNDFWAVVKKHNWHGWTGEGSEAGQAWRTRVIYTTNIRKSYSAGRFAQLTEPSFAAEYPFWEWVHSGLAKEPRGQHLAWHGMTLHHSDPFWRTYYPPRIPPDYGCTCYVRPVRRPKQGNTTTPPQGWEKSKNPGAGSPPEYLGDFIRYFVEQKTQKLPVPELQEAYRNAAAAYRAARDATVVVPPSSVIAFAEMAEPVRGRKLQMFVGPHLSTEITQKAFMEHADQHFPMLTGYAISLDNSSIQHTIKNHGNAKAEANRGHIHVTLSDFGLIEQIVNTPDSVKYEFQMTHNSQGQAQPKLETLLFAKEIDAIGYLVVMRISRGVKALTFVSMRKKPKAWQMDASNRLLKYCFCFLAAWKPTSQNGLQAFF